MQKHENYEHYPGAPEISNGRPEAQPVQPRVYVASLSDYNAGRLHGRWLDAAQDVETLSDEVHVMLRASPEPVAEEFAIHDAEGFGGYRVDEYDKLETVSALAQGIVEHGPIYGALAEIIGGDVLASEPERFHESYLGQWPDLDDFVREMTIDMGWDEAIEQLPKSMQPFVHIDYDQLAREVQTELAVVELANGVAILDPRLW